MKKESQKILLSENDVLANAALTNEQHKINNAKALLAMLQKLGLTVDSVSDWGEIEPHFRKDYPKATLQFNIEANGIEEPYRAAEAFFQKNWQSLRFEPMTEQEIEDIKEQHRIYAETPGQIEAYNLIHSIKDNFNRLHSFGVKMDLNSLYDVIACFGSSLNSNNPLQISERHLIRIIGDLK
jgi:hypothetical protein